MCTINVKLKEKGRHTGRHKGIAYLFRVCEFSGVFHPSLKTPISRRDDQSIDFLSDFDYLLFLTFGLAAVTIKRKLSSYWKYRKSLDIFF